MKDYYVYFWCIGSSKASCGLEPRNVRFHCKAENEKEAFDKWQESHKNLDNGNIIKIDVK